MNKLLPNQFKLNTNGFIKLSLITLALSLSLGVNNRAHAQSASDVEVIAVPPQEAYFVEDKAYTTSDVPASNSQDGKVSEQSSVMTNVSNRQDNKQNLAKAVNSTPSTQNPANNITARR